MTAMAESRLDVFTELLDALIDLQENVDDETRTSVDDAETDARRRARERQDWMDRWARAES